MVSNQSIVRLFLVACLLTIVSQSLGILNFVLQWGFKL